MSIVCEGTERYIEIGPYKRRHLWDVSSHAEVIKPSTVNRQLADIPTRLHIEQSNLTYSFKEMIRIRIDVAL